MQQRKAGKIADARARLDGLKAVHGTRKQQMRYEKGHKDATRQRIVEVASRQFRERGVAAGRAAVSAAGLDPGLLEDLARMADLGPRLVVRSSTELDGDGAWSGRG